MLINRNSPHGADIYRNRVEHDFSSNVNPFGTPEEVKRAVILSLDKAGDYPDPYCTKLRERLSVREGVHADSIICGNGAAELIYQFAYSLGRDRPALVVSPTFCEYGAALDAAGVKSERYMLKYDDGFRLTRDVLPALAGGYCALFLCTPNNPTGITADRELLYAVAERCSKNGVRLFLDLCFADLSDAPDKYDIPELVDGHPGLFVLKAFTKSFAMAGVRLGYGMCSDKAFLERMCKKAQCWNVSVLAQQAGIAALDCAYYVQRCREALILERERMKPALRAMGAEVFDGEANYLLLRTERGAQKRLLQKGILVRDCSNYPGLDGSYIRIAVKGPEENEIILSALKEILQK